MAIAQSKSADKSQSKRRITRAPLMENLESRTLLSALAAAALPALPAVGVVASRPIASEVNGATTGHGSFTFIRTGPRTDPLTVTYTVSGTATSGSDFTPLTGSVTFDAGKSTAKVDLFPLADNIAEGNENVIVTLDSSADYRSLGRLNSARVTIRDSAPTVTVTATRPNASEVNGDTSGAGVFTLRRTGPLTDPLTVSYTITGTASSGTDFTPLTGTVTFEAGKSTAKVVVNPVNDGLVETSETVILTLNADPAVNLGNRNSATVTIGDSSPTVSISAVNGAVESTVFGPINGEFLVTRSGSTELPITVNYTVTGIGISGDDFVALPGSVTIPAGVRRVLIDLTPIADNVSEPTRSVILTLQPGADFSLNSNVRRQSATVNIFDTFGFAGVTPQPQPVGAAPAPNFSGAAAPSVSPALGAGLGTSLFSSTTSSFANIVSLSPTSSSGVALAPGISLVSANDISNTITPIASTGMVTFI